ncbi:hypothetical protein COCON_G00146080 [Conger conger]|uniref:Uncharacterized protein n=1 Tax=Conger conger TaxID=82655 RepID=A0A9Q1DC93_CONCO|nr:hypothetical protein COCON_G00146080 [Conger conger]
MARRLVPPRAVPAPRLTDTWPFPPRCGLEASRSPKFGSVKMSTRSRGGLLKPGQTLRLTRQAGRGVTGCPAQTAALRFDSLRPTASSSGRCRSCVMAHSVFIKMGVSGSIQLISLQPCGSPMSPFHHYPTRQRTPTPGHGTTSHL